MTREEFSAQLPELVKNYQPAADVLSQARNLELLMVVGPSGVGKTTLIQGSGLAYVPGDTTRTPRPEEKNGEDYYFRSDFDQIAQEIHAGRFVQVAIGPGGDFYSTKATSFPASGVATMAVLADVLPIFRNLGFKKTISAFVTPPSYDEWMRRLLIHRLSPEQFAKRIEEAKRSLELSLNDPEMHFIMNDEIDPAENQLASLLTGNIDQTREGNAKQAAQALLARLSDAKS
jgi:guanylate kinase